MEHGRAIRARFGGERFDQRGLANARDAVDEDDQRAIFAEQLPEDGCFHVAPGQRS